MQIENHENASGYISRDGTLLYATGSKKSVAITLKHLTLHKLKFI